MKMRLPSRLRISYPLFQYLLRLLYELSVKVNRVARNSTLGIVLPEDELGSLLVVLIHHLGVALALF